LVYHWTNNNYCSKCDDNHNNGITSLFQGSPYRTVSTCPHCNTIQRPLQRETTTKSQQHQSFSKVLKEKQNGINLEITFLENKLEFKIG
jgi:hypothetical protein